MSIDPIGAGAPIPLPPGAEQRTEAERAALGFERMLLLQLTQQLAKSTQGDDEETSGATQAYKDLLPGALADSMIAGGGIGLSTAITKDLR